MNPDFLRQLEDLLRSMDDRITALEHTLNDVVIGSLREAAEEYDYEDGLEAFRGEHPEVAEYDPRLKALYGEDYDATKAMYDALKAHEGDEGFDAASYVTNTLADLDGRLGAFAEASKAKPEVTVVEEETPAEQPSEEQLMKELQAAL